MGIKYVMNPRNYPRSWLPVETVDVDIDEDLYDDEFYEVNEEEED